MLGFRALPAAFFGFLVGMIILYLLLVEIGKVIFYEHLPVGQPLAAPVPHKRARHRASRWSVPRLVRDHHHRAARRRTATTNNPSRAG